MTAKELRDLLRQVPDGTPLPNVRSLYLNRRGELMTHAYGPDHWDDWARSTYCGRNANRQEIDATILQHVGQLIVMPECDPED